LFGVCKANPVFGKVRLRFGRIEFDLHAPIMHMVCILSSGIARGEIADAKDRPKTAVGKCDPVGCFSTHSFARAVGVRDVASGAQSGPDQGQNDLVRLIGEAAYYEGLG
jgi:hypothetical protein